MLEHCEKFLLDVSRCSRSAVRSFHDEYINEPCLWHRHCESIFVSLFLEPPSRLQEMGRNGVFNGMELGSTMFNQQVMRTFSTSFLFLFLLSFSFCKKGILLSPFPFLFSPGSVRVLYRGCYFDLDCWRACSRDQQQRCRSRFVWWDWCRSHRQPCLNLHSTRGFSCFLFLFFSSILCLSLLCVLFFISMRVKTLWRFQ